MTKEELEKKIKNKESVWYGINNFNKERPIIIKEISLDEKNNVIYMKTFGNDKNVYVLYKKGGADYYPINNIFATKKEAQHYLNNANVIRIEKFPYITWEEFKNGKDIQFTSPYGDIYSFFFENNKHYHNGLPNSIILYNYTDRTNVISNYHTTEENFYIAYDIARRLFLGEC